MRKFFLVLLFIGTVVTCKNGVALNPFCIGSPDNWTLCTKQEGQPNCCAPSSDDCKFYCLTIVDSPVLPETPEIAIGCIDCNGVTDWTNVTGQNYQHMCKDGLICVYRCKDGYYGSDTLCTKCPDNANCPAGSTTFTCNQGYYKPGRSGTECKRCPEYGNKAYGTTKNSGSTSIADCYIPENSTVFEYLENGTYHTYTTEADCPAQ